MKRTAAVALLLLVASLVAVLGWQAAARERAYRGFIAEGERGLAGDETFVALEAFSGAIALRNDSMLAYLRRGETYQRRGETGQALRDLRTAARLDPRATRPHELLGDLNMNLGRYARAVESFEAYLRVDDRSPRVLYKLALARLRLGQPATALPALEKALAVDDHFAEACYLMGLCQRALGRPDAAIAALEQALRLRPTLHPVREELADLYAAARREKDAVAQLEALAVLEPGRVDRGIAIGMAHARGGRRDLAVLTLRQIAEQEPENTEVYVAIARIWLEQAENSGDRVALRKAQEALGAVSRRTTPGSDALTLLGRAHLLAGDYAAAERSFRQATARVPVDPAALLQLSLAAERAGHLATARDALLRYTALTGDGLPTPDRAAHLGDLSMRLNEPATAVEWFTHTAADAAAEPAAFVHLARACIRAGNRLRAQDAVERGLLKDPKHRALLELQRTLAR